MIKVIIELNLVFPYKISMGTLVEFCSLWDSRILSGGTQRLKAIIDMPSHHFKVIFGKNPIVGICDIPSGMKYFIESLKVKKILGK